MLQDTRLVLDNSLSENIVLREKLEKLSENEKEEIEKSEEDRSASPVSPPSHLSLSPGVASVILNLN
jgi:hypothetical protein